MRPPNLPRPCMHGLPPLQCSESDVEARFYCPSGETVKYRMTRAAIDAVDLYILEQSTACQVWVSGAEAHPTPIELYPFSCQHVSDRLIFEQASPIRVATCNLHGYHIKSGVTAVLPTIQLHQYVATGGHFNAAAAGSSTNTTGSGRSNGRYELRIFTVISLQT